MFSYLDHQLRSTSYLDYILSTPCNCLHLQWVYSHYCAIFYIYIYLQQINESYLDELKILSLPTVSDSSVHTSVVDQSGQSNKLTVYTSLNEVSPLLPASVTDAQPSVAISNIGYLQFSLSFWLLFLHTSCMSPILYTFTAFGLLYLQDNFSTLKSSDAAGDGISLLYLGIAFAPLSGYLIDKIGYRVVIQLIANLMILFLFLVLKYVSSVNPYYSLLAVGLCFSVTEANSLAMVSYVVPSEKLGEAYGIIACGVSIALLFEPAMVGYLRDVTSSFSVSIWLFLLLIFAGACFCTALIMLPNRRQNALMK